MDEYLSENLVSAILKFIRYQDIHNKYEVFMFWGKKLPLEKDKEESVDASRIYCEILQFDEAVQQKLLEPEAIGAVLQVVEKIVLQYKSGHKFFQAKSMEAF